MSLPRPSTAPTPLVPQGGIALPQPGVSRPPPPVPGPVSPPHFPLTELAQYSPDGRYRWDGQRWIPAELSPDRRHQWNGQQWIPTFAPPHSPATPSKVTAGILGILLGDFGLHKFYLGQTTLGILYLAFFWTFIPGLIGFVEGIVYLTMPDGDFAAKYAIPELAKQHPFF